MLFITALTVHLTGCPFEANEDDGAVNVCVYRSMPTEEKTAITLSLVGGTEVLGSGYFKSSYQVVFSPGESQACVSISIADDDECELTETFYVKLADPTRTRAYFRRQPWLCSVLIKDDDS